MSSLFDMIKYGSTDLSNADELRKLPIELFNLYWGKSYCFTDGATTEYEVRIMHLMAWYNGAFFRTLQITAFREALKEYCDEPI